MRKDYVGAPYAKSLERVGRKDLVGVKIVIPSLDFIVIQRWLRQNVNLH
jgi:hypothetical protein